MINIADLEKQALRLGAKDRGRLASILLRSLEDEDDELLSEDEIEKLWLEEAIRRNKEMDDDPSIGRPFAEVMSELRARFR